MINALKSIFVSALVACATLVMAHSVYLLIKDGWSITYFGRLLTAATIALWFLKILALRDTARTTPTLFIRSLVVAGGLILSAIGIGWFQEGSWPAIWPVLLLSLAWVVYIFWYSRFEERTNIFTLGTALPNFELEDSNKQRITSTSFIGRKTILLFYRGNWCPLCIAQIKEVVASYQELEKRGVDMVLISPQPHRYSQNLANKFKVPFQFLVDVNNKAAKKLGIFHKNGLPLGFQIFGYQSDTVMPTVIITDEQGKIVFADLTDNYRVRPEPATFLEVIDGLG